MDKNLIIFDGPLQDVPFMWREKGGTFRYPKDMATRHLFFVLRMIWNHSAPEHLQITPFKHYDFDDFYTTQYMRAAVLNVARELVTRDDLTPYWTDCLRKISEALHGGALDLKRASRLRSIPFREDDHD